MKKISRAIGLGVSSAAVIAAGTVTMLDAPTASATVDSVSVNSSNPVVGGSYTISAVFSGAAGGLLAYFSDNGAAIGGPVVPWPIDHAQVTWTPTTAGTHTLIVSQGSYSNSITVTVSSSSSTTPPTSSSSPTTSTTPPTTSQTQPNTGSFGS